MDAYSLNSLKISQFLKNDKNYIINMNKDEEYKQ